MQRGCVSTLPSSVKVATDLFSVSLIPAKLSGLASLSGAVSDAAWPASRLVANAATGIEVGRLVADGTSHRCDAMTVGAAHDWRLVEPALFTLARAVAGRMAVDAARMRKHLAELGEQSR